MILNKIDDLKLMSGVSIFFEELEFEIRQPMIKDIACIGEIEFYQGLSYFLINKEKASLEIDISDFDLFMYVINSDDFIRSRILSILMLTIDNLDDIQIFDGFIILKVAGHECIIDEPKFLIIKETYQQIFCLLGAKGSAEFDPIDSMASKIAEKLRKRKEKLSGQKPQQSDPIFSNFISILTVGSNSLNISDCLNMTVFQIYNIIKRFNLHSQYTAQMQALMQGAQDIELVEWTKQI